MKGQLNLFDFAEEMNRSRTAPKPEPVKVHDDFAGAKELPAGEAIYPRQFVVMKWHGDVARFYYRDQDGSLVYRNHRHIG